MTAGDLWPDVATALDELNESARAVLRLPGQGDWVRQMWRGSDDEITGPTWHIADRLIQVGVDHEHLRPLCGRVILIERGQRALTRPRRGRYSTVDIRADGEPGKECWHCLRKREAVSA